MNGLLTSRLVTLFTLQSFLFSTLLISPSYAATGPLLLKEDPKLLYQTGDTDSDGDIDKEDIVYLLNYLHLDGPPPDPLERGDANSDGIVDDDDLVYLEEKITQPIFTQASCGDLNRDGVHNVLDVVLLVDYVFRGAPPPNPVEIANVNGVDPINVLDVVYLIDYVFRGGPFPACPPRSYRKFRLYRWTGL